MSNELITPLGLARRPIRQGPPVDNAYDHATQQYTAGSTGSGRTVRFVAAAGAVSSTGISDGPPSDVDL